MEFPTLETERLILREWTDNDAPELYEIFRHESVVQYTGSFSYNSSEDSEKKLLGYKWYREKELGLSWAVIDQASGSATGSIEFTYEKKHFRAELGCSFLPTSWGKGFASEAMNEIIRFGFEDFPLFKINRLEAGTDPRNISAIKLLEKLGFKKEAMLHDYLFERGKFVDQLIFGLVRSDHEQKR